jgi:hypothetical protein
MMTNMIEYDESAEIFYVRLLSLAFLEPNNIFRWLKDGRSPRELLDVVCVLMTSVVVELPMQDRLSHVRVFISCNIDLLKDPTPLASLTVTDVVKQLVLQESDSVFESNTDPQWNPSIERGVVWVNKPSVQYTCRWTIQVFVEKGQHSVYPGGTVMSVPVWSVRYSTDGSRMARGEGNDGEFPSPRDDVVVCDDVVVSNCIG